MTGEDFTRAQEGYRDLAYLDTENLWTLGYGQHTGICQGQTCTEPEAAAWFTTSYQAAKASAARDLGATWADLDDVRAAAFTDMAFEMGGAGLAEFHQMIAAAAREDWQAVQVAALTSRWAMQVSTRARAVAGMLLTGTWPA